MVPAQVLTIEALPLSANGKVDRKRVADLLVGQGINETATYDPPRDRLERQVAEIWCEVLQREQISRLDDFFLIGGDSLRATQIVQLLQSRRIGPAPVPLFVLFSSPTVAALAGHIRKQWQELTTVTADSDDPIEEGTL
ncbi:phosphopantetheine-binding protein [Ottowia testudinis]|uniref:Carrier domain-containing protein n=1 Tax=Ottowia testudinis TaxID=2816950 RepID=A0A975H4Y5_9BURK|nr:hypothetical protein J1M35_10310 [Ottowia testudinis]